MEQNLEMKADALDQAFDAVVAAEAGFIAIGC